MAKIAEYLKQILSARYGRDVRQSIHDAISAINDESTECWATVEKVPETLAIAAVKDRVSGKDVTLPMSSDFVATDFNAKGNTEQDTTSGKNLLDCSGLSVTTTNGVTFTPVYDEKGLLQYINANGANNGNNTSVFAIPVALEANTDYILNGCNGGGSSTYRLYVANTTNSDAGIDYGRGASFNTGEVTSWIVRIRVEKGVTVNNVKFYPMIRLATITDGTYEPFTNGASPNPEYPQEIKSVVLSEIRTCGNNLWNHGDITEKTKSFIDWYLPAGTYTFSSNVSNPLLSLRLYFNKEKNNDDSVLITINSSQKTFTLEKDVYMFNYSTTYENTISNIQVEAGTTATAYEPYTESVATLSNTITLNGLNGVQDYVDVKRGVENHKFKTVVFDGSESGWREVSLTNGLFRADIDGMQSVAGRTNRQPIICSHYEVAYSSEKVCCFLSSTQGRISFVSSHVSTLDEWKEWLSSNNVTVVFELAEPIETPLSEADVEALKNIRTFKGTTHIFTDSEVKPDLEVEYVIDTKMYIDKKIAELS